MFIKSYLMSPIRKKYQKVHEAYRAMLPEDEKIIDRLELTDLGLANQSCYLRKWAGYPVYRNTDIHFFGNPITLLEAIKVELANAGRFIFIECSTLEDSVVWKGLEDILREKAEAGVEVRLLYDENASRNLDHEEFLKRMTAIKVRVKAISAGKTGPVRRTAILDYRKILVIDGKIGFTGDFEMTNERFSMTREGTEWKNGAICISGDAVRSMTMDFLKLWNLDAKNETPEDPVPYLLKVAYRSAEGGFVQPFGTLPFGKEKVGKSVYLNLLQNARKSCQMILPEGLGNPELRSQLMYLAKRGVDVSVIIPGTEKKKEKKLDELLNCGVHIMLCEDKNLAARYVIADDAAVLGNLHYDAGTQKPYFENGIWFAGCRAILMIRHDFDQLAKKCRKLAIPEHLHEQEDLPEVEDEEI